MRKRNVPVRALVDSTVQYRCKENDNRIKLVLLDGEVDELHFANEFATEGWLIVGFNDLKRALQKVGLNISPV
jgi:hypothetical protein